MLHSISVKLNARTSFDHANVVLRWQETDGSCVDDLNTKVLTIK